MQTDRGATQARLLRPLAQLLAAGLVLTALCTATVASATEPPADAAAIQDGIGQAVAALQASGAGKAVDDPERLVAMYILAHDAPPAPEIFLAIRALIDEWNLGAEEVLSLVIRGDQPRPSWDQCRRFVEGFRGKGLRMDPRARRSAERLAATDPRAIVASVAAKESALQALPGDQTPPADAPAAPQSYSTYFGYLHSHSALSLDATGDPYEAYRTARDVAGLDFFALTDHAEFLVIWPWDDKWDTLRDAADVADRPGAFAALWGFEWSNPVLGHVTVLNSEDFVTSLAPFGLGEFYAWLSAEPDAFGVFNHPGDFDFIGVEFYRFAHFPIAERQMTGIEVWNTNTGFDRYYYSGSWSSDLPYYDLANQRGWRVGASGGQDNHRADWGLTNDFRVGVLAEELTRDGIAEAFLARRFYATEDSGLHLDFRSSGHPMGSRLTELPRAFTVTAWDAEGDAFAEVRLLRNGVVIETAKVAGNPVEAAFTDPDGQGDDYYYVIVAQTDDSSGSARGDEAISAPIWFFDAPSGPPAPACGAAGDAKASGAGITPLLLVASAPALLAHIRRRTRR